MGVATCRLAPLLCLFNGGCKDRKRKKKKGEARGDATVYKRKAASDVFTGHGRLTDSGLGWSHRHAFLQRCVKLRFYFIFPLAEGNLSLEKGARVAPLGKRETAQSRVVYGGARVLTLRGLFLEALTLTFQKRGSLPPTSPGMIDAGRSERDSASGG